jgi:hypothetical protein
MSYDCDPVSSNPVPAPKSVITPKTISQSHLSRVSEIFLCTLWQIATLDMLASHNEAGQALHCRLIHRAEIQSYSMFIGNCAR